MWHVIFARLGSALVVVLGVSLMVFLLIHLIPGDPVEVMLGESANPADKVALRHQLGLDQPLLSQLRDYYSSLVHLDLGQSIYSREDVAEKIFSRLPATAELALISLGVAISIAFPLGMLAALKRGSLWDHLTMMMALSGVSIPNFWLGPILIIVFSLGLGWFPVSGNESVLGIVLPAVTLGTALAAVLSRMVRSTLVDVLSEDYILTARAKGLAPFFIVYRHGLRNALLPVVTVLGLQFGTLLAGAVITEIVFSWPGVGQLTIEAIQKRDYPVLQGCVLLISLSYVLVNTMTDLVYQFLDPRIRLG
ncbi:MAG: ABC transporter permease [Gammaproteobacteria bacterium]|nr:MAG: ABC transporter permease [Gammaproteobacteria bacterium]